MKSPLAAPSARSVLPAAAVLTALAVLSGCAGSDPKDPASSTVDVEPSGSPSPSGSAPSGSPSEEPSEAPSTEKVEPASTKGWRTEVWHDLQLEVPSDWAVGYAPFVEGGDVLECGVGPLGSDGPDGPDGPDTTTAYVGRPGAGSDACDGTGDIDAPEQDFVWFGSPLGRGEREEDGRTVTTVEVDDELVSVGAAPEVATAILASLREVGEDDNGCPAQPREETRYPAEGFGDNLAMAVCVYQANAGAGDRTLRRTWTERLGPEEADRLVRGVALGRRADCAPSEGREREQKVLLRVEVSNDFGGRTLMRDYLVELGDCPAVLDLSESVIGTPRPVALSERIMAAWAGAGVQAYVAGGSVPGDVASYFKPVMG